MRQNHVLRGVISHTEQYSAKEPMRFLRQHSQLHGILLMLHFSDLSRSLTSLSWGLTHVVFLKKCVVSNFVRFYFGAPSDISCRCCPYPAFHRISLADVLHFPWYFIGYFCRCHPPHGQGYRTLHRKVCHLTHLAGSLLVLLPLIYWGPLGGPFSSD